MPEVRPIVAASHGRPRSKSQASKRKRSGASGIRAPLPPRILGDLAALETTDRLVPGSLETCLNLHGGLAWFLFRVDTAGEGEPNFRIEAEAISQEFQSMEGPGMREALVHAAFEGARRGAESTEVRMIDLPLATSRCVVMALPVFLGGEVKACVCRVQREEHRRELPPVEALQGMAHLFYLAGAREEAALDRNRFGKVAAFIELLAASETGADFPECALRMANHLRDVMGCDTVALAHSHLGGARLAAVSGDTGPVEMQSGGRRALLAHLGEAMESDGPIVSKKADASASAMPTTAGAALVEEWFNPAVSIAAPLVDREDEVRGGWLFLCNKAPESVDEKLTMIRAATPEVAPMMALLKKAKPGPVRGLLVRLWRKATRNQRRVAVLGAVLALVVLAIPVRFPVKASAELQPVVRRVIAAPFEGILKQARVRAGDAVSADQVLAEMDGREIRSRLGDALARRERAAKEADQFRASGRIADSRIANLEAESLAHEIALLESRREHLQIRSPIDGIVLRGDLERSEGAPLRTGDSLFEVAPLDRIVVELAVEASDISLVEAGDAMSLRLESDPDAKWKGEIVRVSPKSEWADDRNVFICEAEFSNPDGTLRPGLKGKGKISGPWRPLAWVWLRDAWKAARYHLG